MRARLAELIGNADLVLDCSDNFTTQHAINRACVALKVPLVSGAAILFEGQISMFDARDDSSPCYACLFPSDQEFEEIACAAIGVFASLVGIIGSMQACRSAQTSSVSIAVAGRVEAH